MVLAESTIRRITEGHAQAIFEAVELDEVWPTQTGHEDLIAEMDGGMVPTVEPPMLRKRTNARARSWSGKRPKFVWRTPRGARRLPSAGRYKGMP